MVEQVCQCRPEEGDVGDGEAERVDLGEALLVGEGRHVQPQLLERRVDARRAAQHKANLFYLNLMCFYHIRSKLSFLQW